MQRISTAPGIEILSAQMHSSLTGVLAVDPAGEVLIHNKRLNELWQIPPRLSDIAEAKTLFDFLVTRVQHPQRFEDLVAELRNDMTKVSREVFALVDGTTLESYSAPLCDAEGNCHGRTWMFIDETERGLGATALSDSERRFQQVTDSIGDVFWVRDVGSGHIIYVSPAFETIWGRPCASVCGDPLAWLDSIIPEDQPLMMNIATAGVAGFAHDYRIARPDGSIRWIHDRGFPVKDKDGVVYRIAGLAVDTTERRELEERLMYSQKMDAVGELAGGVAHDFNNMLSAVLLQSSLALSETQMTQGTRAALLAIQGAVDRASNLTRQLLTFSRQEAMQPQDIDICDLVSTTGKLLSRVLGDHIAFDIQVPAQVAVVNADPGMLEQILMNLVVNARDAMPNGGKMAVILERREVGAKLAALHSGVSPGSFVCLTLRDTGAGIAPEILPRIFEPFFTTKRLGKGTGLGLSTVFGIAQLHKGWVEVASTVGVGTTFRVILPSQPDGTPCSCCLESDSLVRGHESILLVEDEAMVRELSRTTLEQCGYKVWDASSAAAAIELWPSIRSDVDVLFTDIVMPDMSGLELAAQLQTDKPTLKVIYTTGYSSEMVKELRWEDKRMTVLRKPYSAARLAKTMRMALDVVASFGALATVGEFSFGGLATRLVCCAAA